MRSCDLRRGGVVAALVAMGTLLAGLDTAATRPGVLRAMTTTGGFLLRNLLLMTSNRWHRFGYACVNFGSPVSMRAYCRARGVDFQKLAGEERRNETAALGEHLMRAVARIVPVVPVPLMATVFVRNPGRGLAAIELKTEVERIVERLDQASARIYVPRRDLDYALDAGLRMLIMRHLVDEKDGVYVAREAELPLLTYYANSIAHLVEERAPVLHGPGRA